MTQDEPDTCRICSAPAEPDAPLFHPCKCSGTIRYIHQDCLTTWLAHSKKKSCDVCKYQYSFTKVYSENMPRQIPFILFLRKFAQKTFWAIVLGLRGLMVATIWLAFLPYVTVWTWRFYFIMGENIAWWIYDHPRPNLTPPFHSYFTNLTLADDQNRTISSDRSVMDLVTSYPIWRALSADIFTGQIIASLIVLVFLGVFLLREWIVQNARPGVFEDEDAVDDEVQVDDEVEAEPVPFEEALPQPQDGELDNQDVANVEQVPANGHVPFVPTTLNDSLPIQGTTENALTPPRLKRRLDALEDSDDAGDHEQSIPRFRAWRKDESVSPEEDESAESSMNPKRAGYAVDDGLSAEGVEGSSSKFTFSFAFERPAISRPSSSSESESFSFGPPPSSENLFQYTPSSNLPFPLTPNNITSSEAGHSSLRRPHMPSIDLSASEPQEVADDSAVSLLINSSVVPGSSKGSLPSPSLATYQAPEQLDVDTSSVGSRTEDDDDDESHNSEAESVASSTVATVGEVAYREDLDEYFPEHNVAVDERQDPIRVEELLDDEDIHPDEQDRPDIAEEPDPVDAAEDPDAMNDDDVDGALEEAVGMRGPLTTVFQNAALMIFVLDTTIGLAVWLPFTIGKTTALLSLEPVRIASLLQWPVRIIRYATDPVVDLLALALFRGVQPVMRQTSDILYDFLARTTGLKLAAPFELGDRHSPKTDLNIKAFILGSADGRKSMVLRGMDHVADSPVGHLLEPYFAQLGRSVRLNAVSLTAGWTEMAKGDATVNKLFAIALGYLLASFLLAIYLNVLNVGNVQSAGRAIRSAIRQQLIVLKVAVFIVIELVVFPLGCGTMLDFCTLQLFPDASSQSRLSFFAYAPVTATFYHWMVGTMFMYQFAILLGGCRKIIRPGGLWFIKDPQDQNFHPIRDILDRPTFTQIRKLAISAVMYSFVVALGMGGLVASLHFWGRFLLPLRWKLRTPSEPLSDIPLDLLFLHIVMPSTIKYFRPRRLAFALATQYWKWAARQLRITSYMFGGMHPDEMRPSRGILSLLSLVTGFKNVPVIQTEDTSLTSDGSYRRVPAQDNISLPRDVRATVAVDKFGSPVDEAGRRLMELQNSEAEKAKRIAADDYTVVYLPPRFRERVIIFIMSLWIVGSTVLVAGVAIPTLLGRAVFSIILGREVHDGYSVILGFYLLWGCYHAGMILDRMDKRRQRYNGSRTRGKYAVYVFKRAMLWIGNVVWVAFWFGIVIPTLLALVIEVYLVHPLRLLLDPNLTLKIRIFDSWAIGLVYTKMVLSTMRLRPETRLDTAIKEMKEHGWRHLNAVAITLDIIAPVATGLFGMLLLPILVVLLLQQFLHTKISSNTLFLYVYPGLFVFAAIARMYTALQSLCGSWAQQIRDSEFLVEMRLRNLEPPNRKPSVDVEESSPDAIQVDMETLQTD